MLLTSFMFISACATTSDPVQQEQAILEPAIIAVAKPGAKIPQGATFAWLPEAVNFYKDERLDSTSIQYNIESSIKKNLADMGFKFAEQSSSAQYSIAYTAALESSLDDTAILRRFGLVPGNMRVPTDNPEFEKGTLIIYALENKTGEVIWRSAVQAAVDFTLEMEQRKERIGPIVADMFRSLPVDK
jgi:hypothetical protein